MKRFLLRFLTLPLLAALLATVHGYRVGPPPSPQDSPFALALEEARAFEDAIWIDARPAEAFAQAHYPGALHLYDDNWDAGLGEFLARWSPGQVVIIYCDGASCEKSRSMAREFREDFGIDGAYWLVGGFETLLDEGVLP